MLSRRVAMALRRASKKRNLTFRSARPKHASVVGTLLHKRGQDLNRFSKSSNSVHPVMPIVDAPRSSTSNENIQAVSVPAGDSATISRSYVVKVRVLHGIDLHIPNTKAACQHAVRPVINITVNGSPIQSCAATQHARNHSIWKKHDLKFQVRGIQDPSQPNCGGEVPSFISMHVSLSCTTCSCSAKPNEKLPRSVEIGEVGELQLPAKEHEDYEISRFFPVIRQQFCSSQSAGELLPAGKVKFRVLVEVENPPPEPVVAQPAAIKRPPFALPTNFGEALQLKRKQLKSTVVPEDNSQKMSIQDAFNIDSPELLREISVETAPDQIDAADLKVENRVGEGIHSCVSRGVLRSTRQVAVKEFRHQHVVPPVNVLRAFQQEYRVLDRCRGQNGHQYVVELLGVTLQPRLIILMEYFNLGSLAQCLQDEAAWGRMSFKQKAALGLKIAHGIAWLHKHNVIHRDIKSHNILLRGDLAASSPTVKIGDLGSAVFQQQHEPLLLGEVGSSGYTAPEIFTHNGYDSKVDVWGFGIVLWELASGSQRDRINPFTGIAGEEFFDKAQSGCRPKLTHEHQLCVGPVVEKCWAFDPSQRPTMDEVVIQLEKLYQELWYVTTGN